MATIATMLSFAVGVHSAKNAMLVDYVADGAAMQGYISYNPTRCTASSKCPAVVIIHDWNGMNGYEKERACMLADMGYVAFAADIYGTNMPVANMNDWMAASGMHRNNATKYMTKMHGAISKVMTYDFVDTGKMAAMGYCFGGTGLINIAMAGYEGFPGVTFPAGLLGVVSFHGGLSAGYVAPVAGASPKLLVHSGAKDDSNEHIENLTSDLENKTASYEIHRYGSGIVHSFTEWDASVPGMSMFSAHADKRSWEATTKFFDELFTSAGVNPVGAPSMSGLDSKFVQENVSYMADGEEMLGYMIYDSSVCSSVSKCPSVVVIQDWNGMNDYEKERAYLLAQQGYVAFAADIYGVNMPKASMSDWIAAASAHRSNATMYMSKIYGAVAQVLTYDVVDADKLAAIGYCFGGTGLVNLAMAGHDGIPGVQFPTGLKGVVSFHGGLGSGYLAPAGTSRPKVLLHSGGKDDANGDISKLTDDLEGISASYEITRYGSNVLHSFTEWSANLPAMGAAYNPRADFRSWQDTLAFFHEIFVEDIPLKGSHQSALVCDQSPPSPSPDSVDPSASEAATKFVPPLAAFLVVLAFQLSVLHL